MTNTPVTLRATVYRRDVRFQMVGLQKKGLLTEGKLDGNGIPVPKGSHSTKITKFSGDSARRLRFFVRQAADLFDSAPTLTYPGNWDRVAGSGPVIKAHINAFTQWLRRLRFCGECKNLRTCGQCHELAKCSCCKKLRWASPLVRRSRCVHDLEATPCETCGHVGIIKTAYVWILEFQPRKDRPQGEREAPHFHFLMVGRIPTTLLSRRWYEIVGSGDAKHFAAGTRIEKALNPDGYGAYMGAYVSKLEQKGVPLGFRDVGRFWGATRTIERSILEFDATYAEAAKRLRDERKGNVGARRQIASDQAARAILKFQEADAMLVEVAKIPQPKDSPLSRLVTRGARPKFAGPSQKQYDIERDSAKKIYFALPLEQRRLVRSARKTWVSYKGCAFRAVSYARRWRWRGRGFVCLTGAPRFKQMLARSAAAIDSGRGYTKYAPCDCIACYQSAPTWPTVKPKMRLASPLRREIKPDLWREFVAPPRLPLRRACILPGSNALPSERELCAFETRLACRCACCRLNAPSAAPYLPPALRGQLLLDGKLAPDFRPEDFASGLTEAIAERGIYG